MTKQVRKERLLLKGCRLGRKEAILSDAHGNDPALQKVLEDAVLEQVDQFILSGDSIFDLPFSEAVVARIFTLENAHMISGNKEGLFKR